MKKLIRRLFSFMDLLPDQAWFWTEHWQEMERQAQADIDAGRVHRYAHDSPLGEPDDEYFI